jgi:hypothetical protein
MVMRSRILFVLISLSLILLTLLALPSIARRLPDWLQAPIPDRLWALVETPLPTALPTAQVTAVPIAPDIFAQPTATAVPLPPTRARAAEVRSW